MKIYLFILLAVAAVSCKSDKEKEVENKNPKMEGTWTFATPLGSEQYWLLAQNGEFNITVPENPDYVQTGKWTVMMENNDSVFTMTMDNKNVAETKWAIRQHSDTLLVIVQNVNGREVEIKLRK